MLFNKKEGEDGMETKEVEGYKTIDELRAMSDEEFLRYRGQIEDKLTHIKENNDPEDKIISETIEETEKYLREVVEVVYKEKVEDRR